MVSLYMFGYVKPYVPELKVAEYERYRGTYCGLCRSMGAVTGQTSRLTLSYDFVFLAAVRMALTGVEPTFSPCRCAAHPMKKRAIMDDNEALRDTAALAGVLAGAKNRDDLADETGMARIRPLLLRPLLKEMTRRGSRALPDKVEYEIFCMISRLSALEEAGCTSADQMAEQFGIALGYAFALGLEGEAHEIAWRIGHGTGKFVYLCDAADDLTADGKRGRYNPLAAGWGEFALQDGKMSPMVRDAVMTSTPIMLESVGEAADQLPNDHPMTPIIRNIVYLGLPESMRRVLYGAKTETAAENFEGKERIWKNNR